MRLTTSDGVTLHTVHTPGPSLGVSVVLAHGFTGSTSTPAVRRIAAVLAKSVGVLSYDSRGHGRSAGHCTLGEREPLDVDAAVAAARALGYARVVTCGWSMGGSSVLLHAGLRGTTVAGHALAHPPDAVVSVSAVSRWYYRDTVPMRRLHLLVERRLGRLVARVVLRTRVTSRAPSPMPITPAEAAALVTPLPLLLVHGDADAYFPVEHPEALHAAAAHAELWLEPGMGHAETAATPELVERIAAHVVSVLVAGS